VRVVYDTNVLVSAVLKPGSTPAMLVALALTQRVHLCVSPSILAEYKEVLHRPKFGFEALSIDTLLEDLTRTALLVHPTMPWLIDRSHHLYPSGHFFILKFKPLLSFLSLFD
jgi:putative PIN family toxin of toxin-antitoxin system